MAQKPTSAPKPTLAVEDVDEMPSNTRKGAGHAVTPFDEWVSQSYSTGKAKAVTVPEASVKAAVSAIRAAAARLDVGVRIRTADQGGGNVKVYFQGREKRAYNRSVL